MAALRLDLSSTKARPPMNTTFLRTFLLLLHAAANFLLVTWLVDFDITGSWIRFIGFIVLLLALLYFFIRHVLSYIYFLKTKTK
jgi:hypothetical protein